MKLKQFKETHRYTIADLAQMFETSTRNISYYLEIDAEVLIAKKKTSVLAPKRLRESVEA